VTSKSELEVIGAIQKLGCDFLFAFYSNYGAISCIVREISDLSNPIQSTFIPDNKVHNTYYSYSNKSKEK